MRAASSICKKRSQIKRCAFLDFIERENALPVFREDFSQASSAAAFVAHEQLHSVQMQEFRHIEPEHGTLTEQVTGKFQRQFPSSLLRSARETGTNPAVFRWVASQAGRVREPRR